MLRNPLSIAMLGLAVLLPWAGPAEAARLTVQYEIVDGSMTFPFTDPSNPVLGTMTVTIPGTGTTGSFLQDAGPVTLHSFTAATTNIPIALNAPQTGTGSSSGTLSFTIAGPLLATGVLNLYLNLLSATVVGTLSATTIGTGSFGSVRFVGQEISRLLVPEPNTALLLGFAALGALGLFALRRGR